MKNLTKGIISATIAILLVAVILVPITDQTAGDKTLQVYVIAGQSNMWQGSYTEVGVSAEVANEEVEAPATNCYFYGISATQPIRNVGTNSQCSIYPMYSDGQWMIGGEEPSIATAISHKSNCDVLIINVAIPGQAINYFVPGNTGGEHIATTIADALSKVDDKYTVITGGWVWGQGESDKTTAVSDYVSDFGEIRAYFLSQGFDTCYLVQTAPNRSGNATAAQLECCEEYSNVILSSTAPSTFTVANGGLIEGNEVHWTQQGRDIVGTDVGEKIASGLSWHSSDDTYINLMKTIPVLVIVGVVVGLVGLAIRPKDD